MAVLKPEVKSSRRRGTKFGTGLQALDVTELHRWVGGENAERILPGESRKYTEGKISAPAGGTRAEDPERKDRLGEAWRSGSEACGGVLSQFWWRWPSAPP